VPGAGQAEGQRGLAAVRVLVQVGPHLGQARARIRERCRRVLRGARGARRVTRPAGAAVPGAAASAGAALSPSHSGSTASDATWGVSSLYSECQLP